MKVAAEAFFETDEGVWIGQDPLWSGATVVKLSQIFKWYQVDFGNNDKEVRKDTTRIIPLPV